MVKPMSRKRFENLDPDRQQRLFESAADEFGAHGYEAASLNRILENSGMSKSSLYYYFDDKADLFTSMVERSIAFVFREIGGFDLQSLTAENYWDQLEALYRRAIALMSRNAWYVKLGRMFYRLRGNPKDMRATGRAFESARRWVVQFIRRGQELGVVRTDLPETLVIDAVMGIGEALDHWVVAHWDELEADERLQSASDQIDLFKRLLSP